MAHALPLTAAGEALKPPLKWAGGKRWLLPELHTLWAAHQHRRLVEPFCGGLAVTLGLQPEQALLNDANPHAVNFYRWLQKGLHSRLPMRNEEALYYHYRDDFNRLVGGRWRQSKKAAELFYYLNRTGYNGLCRFNKRGAFNVPFGRYARINYRRDFSAYQQVLANCTFSHGDFQHLSPKRDDFIYADPPYDVPFTQYAATGFDWDDQVRLAQWLAQHAGPVVLSNQATARIVELYMDLGFRLKYLQAPRMINCTGDRSPATEVLASRNL